jgi:hypothetical protein
MEVDFFEFYLISGERLSKRAVPEKLRISARLLDWEACGEGAL